MSHIEDHQVLKILIIKPINISTYSHVHPDRNNVYGRYEMTQMTDLLTLDNLQCDSQI